MIPACLGECFDFSVLFLIDKFRLLLSILRLFHEICLSCFFL